MTPARFELHSSVTDRELLTDAADGARTIGLAGLLNQRGHRARRVRVPGRAATTGFRWRWVDVWNTTWWPQGIAVGEHNGIPLAVTSWFAQKRRGHSMGSRISIVDLRNPRRPRYHHVLLVSPRREANDGTSFDPVTVHAGGIAWSGDRLLVAATFGGFREFDLRGILRAESGGMLARSTGLFGYRYLLPEVARYRPPKADKEDRMRYSFVSLDTDNGGVGDIDDGGGGDHIDNGAGDAPGIGASASDVHLGAGDVHLVTGEYSTDNKGHLARLRLAQGRTVIDDTHVPDIPHMQGAVVRDGTWFVNASRGDKQGGDLWVGVPGKMTRHEGVLPIGPEDIAAWPGRNQLWSVTEFPGKRWIYAVEPTRWIPGRTSGAGNRDSSGSSDS
ncbi:MAG: hypothetical protein JWQ43_3467 [Glaciihabitans sp.]|nr:hypothetical protein [Glaciihabitans sp.]